MVVHAVRATSTGYSGGTFKHARPSAASLSPDAVPVEIQLKYADVTERQADLTEEERTEGVKGAVDVHPDGDFISVRNLLKAAHLDLDDISTQTTDREPNRYAGLNIMVKIIFNNNGAAEYAYQPEVLPAEAKLVGEFGINYPYERRVHNQHGVRFKFVISGEIKMFDFKTLLLSFVSGLALTSLAALFVDTLITYVMPQKDNYKLFKYHLTPDFSPEDADEQALLDKILAKKRRERDLLEGVGKGTALEVAAGGNELKQRTNTQRSEATV
eukprot:JP436100.1.p2 GENE.JP436100.1~~JP436100.1.p2  ORF type:complete len:308 (-),score=113.89 JP436100.1:71-883(-)